MKPEGIAYLFCVQKRNWYLIFVYSPRVSIFSCNSRNQNYGFSTVRISFITELLKYKGHNSHHRWLSEHQDRNKTSIVLNHTIST